MSSHGKEHLINGQKERFTKPKDKSAALLDLRKGFLVLASCCLLLVGCHSQQEGNVPSITFSTVPPAAKGGTSQLDTIGGRATGARPRQQIVLFARSGAWYVQPFTDRPFTKIGADSTWKNSTHLGTEYAALLVEPDYRPPSVTDELPRPGAGVIAVALIDGEPVFWQRWWFRLLGGLGCALALSGFYRLRLRQVTKQLNVRFEERLAERMRIAQDLHDNLLQGLISASMQLDVAMDNMPADSPARRRLGPIQQLMGQIIHEGQNTVRGLRSNGGGSLDLAEAFSRIRQDLENVEEVDFRVIVEGRPRPLHPLIRDEVYRIGREALLNAVRHSRAKSIEIKVKYAHNNLRIVVRNDVRALDHQALWKGQEGDPGLTQMREHAGRIGGRLKIRSRSQRGMEIELTVPGHIAFQTQPTKRPLRLFAGP